MILSNLIVQMVKSKINNIDTKKSDLQKLTKDDLIQLLINKNAKTTVQSGKNKQTSERLSESERSTGKRI